MAADLRSTRFFAAGLVLALSCTPRGVESPVAPAPTPTARAALPVATEPAPEKDSLETLSLQITAEVARARSLEFKGAIKVVERERTEIRDFVREALYEELPPEKIRLLGRIEASLGVFPVGVDPETLLLDLYEQAVLGAYDPKTKTLLIGKFVSRAMLGMVVGHEGAHGLQDMHFDLEALQGHTDGQTDRDAARTLLIEGDAQAAYLTWMAADAGVAGIADDVLRVMGNQVLEFGGAGITQANVLARMLQLPYADGTATVVALARERGWSAVDALYRDLPTTSEQMLHLDKLLAREPARSIRVDPKPLLAAVPDTRVIWEDDIGEMGLLAMIAEVETPERARRAAAGWGGDRFLALERNGRTDDPPIIAGLITWDSAAEAIVFEPVFRRYLEHVKPNEHALVRKGHRIVFCTHAGASSDKLMAAAWKGFLSR